MRLSMLFIVILCLTIYFVTTGLQFCRHESLKIDGRWYMIRSEGPASYVEIEFASQDTLRICRDGYYWYNQPFAWTSDSSILINGEEYRLRKVATDTLLVELERGIFGKFAKLEKEFDPFTKEEAILFRRYKFYANQLSPLDSIALDELGYELWALFNDTHIIEDSTTVPVEPPVQ